MNRFWISLLALLLLPASGALGQHPPAQAQGGLPPHLHAPAHVYVTYKTIAPGEAVIFMRHGKTDVLGRDAQSFDFAECGRQRGLSPAGVEASREVGAAFSHLRIPVGDVLASPYCRCMETARLAFGRITPSNELLVQHQASGWTMENAAAALKRMSATPPRPGTNTILVGHVFNALHGFDLRLEEGESVVAVPDGKGGFSIAGRITATQWGDLTRDYLAFGEKIFEMAAAEEGREHRSGAHAPGHHSSRP